jgi:hypothetical protein
MGLRVAVLVPEPTPGSAVHAAALCVCRGLVRAGHDVAVHVDWGPRFADATEGELARYLRAHFEWEDGPVRHGRDLGAVDGLIAVDWRTARVVWEHAAARARFYLLQSCEPDGHPPGDRRLLASASLCLGLTLVTAEAGLARRLRERFGVRTLHLGEDTAPGRSEAEGRGGEDPVASDAVWEARGDRLAEMVRRAVAAGPRCAPSGIDVAGVDWGVPEGARSMMALEVGVAAEEAALGCGRPAGCDVVVPADGLYRIDVRLSARGGAGRGGVVLRVREDATAPEHLALATVATSEIVDGAWQPFRFRSLGLTAGRRLHVSVEAPEGGSDGGPWVLTASPDRTGAPGLAGGDTGGSAGPRADRAEQQRLVLRAWCLEPAPPEGVGPDPILVSWLHARERSLRELQAARAHVDGHPLAPLVRLWARVARPIPPPDCRPWRVDEPIALRLWLALRYYGPCALLRHALPRSRDGRAGRKDGHSGAPRAR